MLYPLANGTPDRAWIILSRRDEWCDGRDIDLRYGAERFEWHNIKAAPESIFEQVREWISEGENYTLEYKREFNKDERTVLKTVVAFANGQGGVILLGVEDDMSIHGVEHQFPQGSLDRYKGKITDLIHSSVIPSPNYLISHCTIDSHTVVVLQVFKGGLPPYTLRGKDGTSVVYVRRNATTCAATPIEIREIVLNALPDHPRNQIGR